MKSRIVAALFAFFLGGLGIDLFYRRHILRGILNLLFCWTGIPTILGFIRGIHCLWMDTDEEFNEKMVDD